MRIGAIWTILGIAALFASISTAEADVRILASPGGQVGPFIDLFDKVRESGERVVIDGPCLSACTLVLSMVPGDRTCVTPNDTRSASPVATRSLAATLTWSAASSPASIAADENGPGFGHRWADPIHAYRPPYARLAALASKSTRCDPVVAGADHFVHVGKRTHSSQDESRPSPKRGIWATRANGGFDLRGPRAGCWTTSNVNWPAPKAVTTRRPRS